MEKSFEETWKKLDWKYAPDEELAQLVKDMVTLGADVNAKNEDGLTALIWAAHCGYTETVKAFVELGADVNAKANNGRTALMGAAEWGHTETVKALVELGADVNAKDNKGRTALMFAAREDYTETKALAELGANVNAKNNEGKSALDYINDEKTKREIIKLAAEYQRKQQEKDSSPKAQNDGKKQPENNTVANNLKNAVESRVQGDKENAPKTRAEVRKELHELEVKKQQLVNSLREDNPEHETRQALAKKLKQIRKDYSTAEALDVAKKNKSVQALREQLKAKDGTR